MSDIFKIIIIAIICAVLSLVVRSFRSELSPFVQSAGMCAVLILGFSFIYEITDSVEEWLSYEFIDENFVRIIYKALCISVFSKTASDLCKDSGNNALSFGVDLISKAAIIALSMPMLKELIDVTKGLLKG